MGITTYRCPPVSSTTLAKIVRSIAPEVEEAAAETEAKLLAKVRASKVEAVGPMAEELAVLLDTIREVRRIVDGQDTHNVKSAARTRTQLQPRDVLVAAFEGWSLLEPFPADEPRRRQDEPQPVDVEVSEELRYVHADYQNRRLRGLGLRSRPIRQPQAQEPRVPPVTVQAG